MACYLESVAPQFFPGGGGFSIQNFTLNMLYEQNLIVRNWWTAGNENMPLIRYSGCTIYLYRQESVDYLFQYNRSYPMVAKQLTYTSTHPQVMLTHKNTIKITCKKHNRNKKPYKKIFVRPPCQMQNRWYFQKDLSHIPLLQTMCTSTSLDRMFLHSTAISSTIGFTSLDILGFRNHQYIKTTTTGYRPLQGQMIFGLRKGVFKVESAKLSDLIYLGNPETYTDGTTVGNIADYTNVTQATNTYGKKLYKAITDSKYWGNPFHDDFFYEDGHMLMTNKTWEDLKTNYDVAVDTQLKSTDFTIKTQRHKECRYNPFADKGQGNKLYLVNVKQLNHQYDWEYPEPESLLENLPVWLLTWGYLDYQRKCGEHSSVDTNNLAVIYSPYIEPKENKYFVPLDQDFMHGKSPYQPEKNLFANDYQNWHPKVRYQVQTINTIATCGPATTKLPPDISCEGHLKYKFHFKVGGNPPPMSTLTDPDLQPKYITPDNLLPSTSLQNPTTPFEYLLWNFDERRGQITKKAAQRISAHPETEKTFLSITEPTYACPTTSKETEETSESSDEEKEETSPATELLKQRKQQKLLRHRIQQLLNRLTELQ